MPRTRKKRKAAPYVGQSMNLALDSIPDSTHEDLQEKAYEQDRQIETLLLQFDKIRSNCRIKEWMAKATAECDLEGVTGTGVYCLLHTLAIMAALVTIILIAKHCTQVMYSRTTRSKSFEEIGRRVRRTWLLCPTFVPVSSDPLQVRLIFRLCIQVLNRDSLLPTPPDIVKHCELYPEDIVELFSMYVSISLTRIVSHSSIAQILRKNQRMLFICCNH